MQKSVRNLSMGLIAAAAVTVACFAIFSVRGPHPRDILAAVAGAGPRGRIVIEQPLDGTLFPPDIAPPLFRWKDGDGQSDLWLVSIEFTDGGADRIDSFVREPQWRPGASAWEGIKKRSLEKQATVTIVGVHRQDSSRVLSTGRIAIKTSADAVGTPLFYREVNLPFADAVKDPSRIRWRFGTISSAQTPPIVLEKLPVCGNCHSFSANGSVLGMDVDYANDKGSYAIAPVHEQMTLDSNSIITWGDYKRVEGEVTYGLLSQVSPDGRYVVSTVKDESVFVPKPALDFSQLFFPVKGILCIYDRQTGIFQSLPGADDPNLVQSNATWSPDGKTIVFAATKAYTLRSAGGAQEGPAEPRGLPRVPRGGQALQVQPLPDSLQRRQGGKPEPLAGASFNGKSNFFPKYSPDGKWIVFCRAENYMLLQPDSELYIIPAEGGEARRLRANTKRMNSWHSFSPNGKWLVFSGKPDSPYTRLYLTHIDENGESTPAIVLDHLTASDRAANIPEFVNADPSAIRHIGERFIDDLSYVRGAWEFLKSNDYEGAERQARKALELNPRNADALHHLGLALFGRGQYDEAIQRLSECGEDQAERCGHAGPTGGRPARQRQSERGREPVAESAADRSEQRRGVFQSRRGDFQPGKQAGSEETLASGGATETERSRGPLQPGPGAGTGEQHRPGYRAVPACDPGEAGPRHGPRRSGSGLCRKGSLQEGMKHLARAVELDPGDTSLRHNLAITLARMGQHDQAIAQWRQILQREPAQRRCLWCVAIEYGQTGQVDMAIRTLEEALKIARSAGDEKLAGRIVEQIQRFSRPKPADAGGSR